MGEDDGSVQFYVSKKRALFPIEGMHVSRSLSKAIRKSDFQVRFNENFEQVMRSCLREEHNWITEEIIQVFCQIHQEKWAHCCEVWRGNSLIGGIYGLSLGTCFSAESMFHRQTNGSKLALWAMIEKCREVGYEVFDAQVMNPHLQSLGAIEVSHDDYLKLLKGCLAKRPPEIR